MIQSYIKKQVVIRACQWTGDNVDEMSAFLNQSYITTSVNEKCLFIQTLEGIMKASVGDYIIEGIAGEFYPCKPDIFEQTYEVHNV